MLVAYSWITEMEMFSDISINLLFALFKHWNHCLIASEDSWVNCRHHNLSKKKNTHLESYIHNEALSQISGVQPMFYVIILKFYYNIL